MATIGQAFKPILLASILARNRDLESGKGKMGNGNNERELEVSIIGR
jgi:hypothetical protein